MAFEKVEEGWWCDECCSIVDDPEERCLCDVDSDGTHPPDPEAKWRRRQRKRREQYKRRKVPSRAERTKREMYWGSRR